MINYVLVAHLLGASVWTGGHLVLALAVLPSVLRHRDIDALMTFESTFEKIGMPALLLQIATGLYMAYQMLPSVTLWFTLDNDLSILITSKILLLTLTALIALHARFRVIPNLTSRTLNWFAIHIAAVTILSIAFVIVGSLFRTGLG